MEPDLPPTRRISVKVGRRDSIASIAARNGVTVAQIKSWNNLSRDAVARGQTLTLHVPNQMRLVHAAPGHSLHHARAAHVVAVKAPAHTVVKASASRHRVR